MYNVTQSHIYFIFLIFEDQYSDYFIFYPFIKLFDNLKNFFARCFIRNVWTYEQIQLQPPFANQLRNYERKLRERGRSKGFLELVDRRITLLPRIDPRQLLISPSFSTLQFGKSFREFKAIFRFLSLSLSLLSSSYSLMVNLMGPRLVEFSLIMILSWNYPNVWWK